MYEFHNVFGKIFYALFLPLRHLSPWYAMILISLLTAFFMLFIFRKTSNQRGISRVKNRIKAHLLELRLYKDSLGTSIKAQGKILLCNLRYISYTGKPMLIMIVPLILILIHLNFWFGYMPISVGEKAIAKVKLEEDFSPLDTQISLISPTADLVIESPPLRIEEEGEINWRFSAAKAGKHEFQIIVGGNTIHKTIRAEASSLLRLSPLKTERNFFRELFYPAEKPFPGNTPVKTVEITYPSRMMNLFGWRIHWLIVYFALSIVFAFGFKGIFKVDI